MKFRNCEEKVQRRSFKFINNSKKVTAFIVAFLLLFSINGTVSASEIGENSDNDYKVSTEKMTDALISEMDDDDEMEDVLVKIKDEKNIGIEVSSYNFEGNSQDKSRNAIVGNLQENAAKTQCSVLNFLNDEKVKGNVKTINTFFIVNAIHIVAKKSVIKKLDTFPSVEKIDVNAKIKQDKPVDVKKDIGVRPLDYGNVKKDDIEWNIKKINADKVWKDYKVTGKGVTVGIIDSAVDYNHPALREKFKGYNNGSYNFDGSNYLDAISNHKRPGEGENKDHGSHCAGIILGSEKDSNGNIKNQIGVSPDSQWISARVFGNAGGESTNDGFLKAAEWMLHPGGNTENAPDIINNSWGGSNDTNDWYKESVTAWRKAGILPVFAAGNRRFPEDLPGEKSISNPANLAESFAVAAVDKDFKRASFSKKGPSAFPDVKEWKPEISAPGVDIRSAVEDGYAYMSGTSMAAPHVAGVAALLRSADNNLTVDKLEELMTETAVKATDEEYPNSPNFGYGYGVVNAYDAISKLYGKKRGEIKGHVSLSKVDDMNNHTVKITVLDTDRSVKAGKNGEYSIMHTEGTWEVEASSYGYESQKKTVTISNSGNVENLDFDLKAKEKRDIIDGIVIDKDTGKPVEGAWVRIVEDPNVKMASTNGNGNFDLYNIVDGKNTIRVFKEGYQNHEESLDFNKAYGKFTISLQRDGSVSTLEGIDFSKAVPSQSIDNNYFVNGGENGGAVVRITPRKKEGVLELVRVKFFNAMSYGKNSCLLHIVEYDDKGRIKFLLKDEDVSFKPGEVKTINVGKYQIKPDRPFYIVFAKKIDGKEFYVAVDRDLDSNSSFVWQGKNILPFKNTGLKGGLLINAEMKYKENAEDLKISVDKPELFPILPSEKSLRGKLKDKNDKPLSDVIIDIKFPNGDSKRVSTNPDGSFSTEIPGNMLPGASIYAVALDINGIESEKTQQYVRNDYSLLETVKTLAEEKFEKIKDDAIKKSLKASLDRAVDLIAQAKKLELEINVSKEEIIDLQDKITDAINEIKVLSAESNPKKKALLDLIKKIDKELTVISVSKDGKDIPLNKYWVTSDMKFDLNVKLMDAKSTYDKPNVRDELIAERLDELKEAYDKFSSYKKRGKLNLFVIDKQYRNGSVEGEAESVSKQGKNKVRIEVKDGKITNIEIIDWKDGEASRVSINQSRYFSKIKGENSLYVDKVEGLEPECETIIEAIKCALGKLLGESSGEDDEDIGKSSDDFKVKLKKDIAEAEYNFYLTYISDDGSEVPADQKYVTIYAAYDFVDVIEEAIKLSKTEINKSKYKEIKGKLINSESEFNAKKLNGTK